MTVSPPDVPNASIGGGAERLDCSTDSSADFCAVVGGEFRSSDCVCIPADDALPGKETTLTRGFGWGSVDCRLSGALCGIVSRGTFATDCGSTEEDSFFSKGTTSSLMFIGIIRAGAETGGDAGATLCATEVLSGDEGTMKFSRVRGLTVTAVLPSVGAGT